MPTYPIAPHDAGGLIVTGWPRRGFWYFGILANGQTGVLAQWDGWKFSNSEREDIDMSIYHHLQEQPPRG